MSKPSLDASNEELMARFQGGEEEAFGELVRRFKDPLTNFAYRMLGNLDDSYDIVQDTFVRVHQSRHTYRPVARLSTWIYTITLNQVRTHLRRRKLRRLLGFERQRYDDDDTIQDFPDHNTAPDEAANSSLLNERIQEALEMLGEKYREVVVLRDIQDLTYEEIAKTTGLNPGTVKSRINRARAFLQKQLKDLMEEGK